MAKIYDRRPASADFCIPTHRMTSRIHDIISSGESETLEFKERFNADVIETAVAFANTRGGQILIGVSNNGKPAGQHFGKEALRDYVNRIVTATEPVVIPAAESHSTAEGEIIALQISEVPLKPVATRGRCYRRAGSTTRVMSAAEIAAMHLRSTGQSMDAVIVARKAKDGLPAPLFENSQGGFRIIFKAGDADKTGALRFSTEEGGALSGALSGALKQQIIQLINDIPGIQRKTIVERTGVPERTVDRCIAECIAENKIERRGSKKTGGYWPLA
ncbi:MAG: putative DNA binding domain-containing protein [Rhodocyclaceae bacterium]|nr:putative DNA binding domain-containing protein [Rhodocyclaceae bacterium]